MRFDHELEAVSMVKAIQLLLIQLLTVSQKKDHMKKAIGIFQAYKLVSLALNSMLIVEINFLKFLPILMVSISMLNNF